MKNDGLFSASLNVPTVIAIPAISKVCARVVIPNTVMELHHILKIMHHIHARTCITICLVSKSGIFDSGLTLLSITEFQVL